MTHFKQLFYEILQTFSSKNKKIVQLCFFPEGLENTPSSIKRFWKFKKTFFAWGIWPLSTVFILGLFFLVLDLKHWSKIILFFPCVYFLYLLNVLQDYVLLYVQAWCILDTIFEFWSNFRIKPWINWMDFPTLKGLW